MKYLMHLLFATALLNTVQAQDSLKKSALSLGIGPNFIINKDQFQSPYNYSGANLLLNGTFSRTGKRSEQDLEFSYSTGNIRASVAPPGSNSIVSAHYNYLFKIKPRNTTTPFRASMGVGLQMLLSNTNYLPKEPLSKNYLSALANLTLNGSAAYTINTRSQLNLSGGISIIGLAYRPDFEINGETLTRIAPVGKNNLFSARFEYIHRLTPGFDLMATYNYSYFTFDEPRTITILQNGFHLGIKYHFR